MSANTREYSQKYYADHAEEIKAYQREWRKVNKERLREYERQRFQDRREKHAEYKREMRRRNPDHHKLKSRQYHFTRRAHERSAPGVATAQQIAWRKELYGGKCWMCAREADTIDHVIPLSRGGSNWPANLRPACATCNKSKGASTRREAA